MDHVTKDFPELLANLKEKRDTNIDMVTIEPLNRSIDHANVRVITRKGACIGRDIAQETVQNAARKSWVPREENVKKKEYTLLPTFNMCQ